MPPSSAIPPALDVFESFPGDPSRDLAFEEEMLRRASDGARVLFLYSWPRPVVVLGRGQPEHDLDLAFCARAGIPFVRRITGGTGVLHDHDLAVSLSLPASHPWSRSIGVFYDRSLEVIQSALLAVGVTTERAGHAFPDGRGRSPICFENAGRETLLVSGRKAVGCAQARRHRAVLVHASLLLGLDPARYGAVFGVPPERIAASIAPLPPLDLDSLRAALVAKFASALGLPVRTEGIPGTTGRS